MSASEQNSTETLLLSIFTLGDVHFAIEALAIQEIIRPSTIRAVPHAPEEVLGIINLRGRIVTVLDPARRMGIEGEDGNSSRILIVESEEEPLGLRVSSIQDVVNIDRSLIDPPPSNLAQALGAFVTGVFRFRDHVISILSLEALVAVQDRT